MEGGGALCVDTSVTHPVKSDDPDIKDKLDDLHTSSDNDGADSGVWSEVSTPRGSSIPDTRQHKSKENMEGGGALCEDTSVTHPVKSDHPDIKDKLDDLHTRDDDAGSTVCIEASRPRGIDFPITQPHKKHMETAPNSHGESDRMSLCSEKSITTGPSFSEDNDDESLIHQLEVCKRCEGSCGVCLGKVDQAVKHCKTCRVSFCETHVVDHYKSPAFSSHELVDNKQTSRLSPAKEQSLQRSSSDPVELPELRMMMLGKTGTGKSASGNTILGREAFKSGASPLPVTKSCNSQSGVVEGRNITVIDTPAITRKAAWLSEKVDPGPHVFLLVIPLGRFTEEDGKEVKWIKRAFGEEALRFTIVLFTGGDQMKKKNGEQFLYESSRLHTLVSSTGGGYHIFDNKTPKGRRQVKGLLEKIELLLRKNTGYSYSYGLHEQVKTAVREEEEMKRRKEEEERKRKEEKRRNEEEKRKRLSQEQERERKRREEKEEEERKKLKMERDIQINEATKTMEKRIEQKIMEQMELKMMTLNELRVVVKATTEQSGNNLQEQVTTAEKEEGAKTGQGGNFLIYLVEAVCGLIRLAGLCFY